MSARRSFRIAARRGKPQGEEVPILPVVASELSRRMSLIIPTSTPNPVMMAAKVLLHRLGLREWLR